MTIKKIGENFSNWLCELPVSVMKLLLIGIFIWILGTSPAGNWIKCKFLDTTGCLAKIEVEVEQKEITAVQNLLTHNKIIEIDNPKEFNNYLCFSYEILLKNKGFERPKNTSLRISPLVTSTNFQPRVLGYETKTGPITQRLIYDSKPMKFMLLPAHFEYESSFLFGWEQAKLEVFICYPDKNFCDWSDKVLLIETECDTCQNSYITSFLDKVRSKKCP